MKSSELIIELLSQKWPLKAKEIYQVIRKQKQVTYQAVHKALKQMTKSKALIKEKGKYSISLDYIIQTRKEWETIEQKYLKNKDF